MVVTTACGMRRGPFACGGEGVGVCQYCGRSFCARHGIRFEEDQAVCSRKVCTAKREDVARHLVYKDEVRRLNLARGCGIAGCAGALDGQCARCLGYFCSDHVRVRDEMVLENRVRVPRVASLCQHCWSRRPLWVKQ